MRRSARALGACGVVASVWMAGTSARATPVASLASLFEEANRAYYAGNFRGAIDKYTVLVESGVTDPDVDFNLATSHARIGGLGQAIRYYEKSLRLRPRDEDTTHNLALVREALGRRLAEARGEALVQERPPFLEAAVHAVSEDTLAWGTWIADAALFATLTALFFVRREAVRLGLGIAAPLVGIALIVFGAGLVVKSGVLNEGHPAIVVMSSAVLREGPDARALERDRAEEGTSVRVLDRRAGYARIRTPERREGWVREAEIGEI